MARRIPRIIIGVILLVIALYWFFAALNIAMRQASFANAVGWAIPFVLVEISIYLLVTGAVGGRYGVVLALAVSGLILVIGGATVWLWRSNPQLSPMSILEASVFTAAIGVGLLLMVVPSVAYVAIPAKTTRLHGG